MHMRKYRYLLRYITYMQRIYIYYIVIWKIYFFNVISLSQFALFKSIQKHFILYIG